MISIRLTLSGFRCYASTRSFDIQKHTTFIVGQNAKGKTTLLEALYFISRGCGFREDSEAELITWGEQTGFVEAVVASPDKQSSRIAYILVENRLTKAYFVNDTKLGLAKYRSFQPQVVLFAPHQLDIIVHGPSYRRDFLNSVLGIDPIYKKALNEYESAIRKRNKILEMQESYLKIGDELEYWNEYASVRASYIYEKRAALIDFLNTQPQAGDYSFGVRYVSSQFTSERLKEYESRELAARRTLIGPQRDDIEIYMTTNQATKVNVHSLASRSQQRLALFWLKVRELDYIESVSGSKPILLLDDIFSEFDEDNKQKIMTLLSRYQSVLATTEVSQVGIDGQNSTTIHI